MRALDFSTQSQVTRETIGLMGEAVPGTKGARKRRKPGSHPASSILGRSNLKCVEWAPTVPSGSLDLTAADSKQIIASHHMQSISLAPGTAEHVTYAVQDCESESLSCPEVS